MEDYVYNEPTRPNFSVLPEGDYDFIVTAVNPAYRSSTGNFVLPVVLAVGPDKVPVYDNPSAGVTKKGDTYDTLASFLKASGKNPKPGERPDLSTSNLVGARGAVRIKIEIAKEGKLAGKEVNKVHYYLFEPKRKDGDPLPDVPRSRAGDNRAIVPPPPPRPTVNSAGEPNDITF